MAKKENQTDKLNPDQVVLNKIQQKRLSMLTGVDEREISGKNIAQLAEALKWRIDPRYFFFEKICGKVVKKDPVTGEYPVPFATVYIEDTDCNLVTYHPNGFPWSWHFPFFCRREVIGTTQTDACGNFCVWVPRFDIDWILQWRRERICFPVVFRRPILIDYIPEIVWPPKHGPGPDPGPIEKLNRLTPGILDSIAGNRGDVIKKQISRIKNSSSLGTIDNSAEEILNKRLFDHEMPPPLPADFQKILSGHNVIASKNASPTEGIRSAITEQLGLGAGTKELDGFNYLNYIGPFYRCYDFYVPVWQQTLDVPDITFRVTQDTNGDGVEETIYSEGYFDVRWNSGSISDVTLVASSIAKESRLCHVPPVPCGDVPDLLFAGLMPLHNPLYFDDSTGYALRPNRPRPGGVPTFPAQTPFYGELQFYGCVDLLNAQNYRIMLSTDDGANFSPITGRTWNNFLGSLPIPISADSAGWYPVQPINPVTLSPVPRTSLEFPNLLLDWPTPTSARNVLKIELGDNSSPRALLATSRTAAIVSDNTVPGSTFSTLSWKYEGESDTALRSLLGIDCPMIQRGAIPTNIELVFEVSVSALHLRDASLNTSGCGGGSFSPVTTDPANKPSHWHEFVSDNSVVLHQRYSLISTSKPGCYSFECTAVERSINPDGHDTGFASDWIYDQADRISYHSISVAVVNEDLS